MWRSCTVLSIIAIAGCGPSAHERTLSILNIEADRWEGGNVFETTVVDPYGQAVSATIERGPLNYTLTLRSSGPDGLPKNNDDIVITRSMRHGESSITQEVAKTAGGVAEGAASGAVKGIKKGLGFGRAEKE
jgi:hypothetical protein